MGTVQALWRFPVKSMQGEEVESSAVDERGLLGDRAFALQEVETGHIVSAKHPRKWASVFACQAWYVTSPELGAPLPPVAIRLPSGVVVRSDDPNVDALISEAVGREVRLISQAPEKLTREANRASAETIADSEVIREETMALASPEGTFFDFAPIHLLTTATLARLREIYPAGDFSPRRFRPNIVIETPVPVGFVENEWLGATVMVGDVIVDIIDPSPRCVVTTLAQGDLPRDVEILRTIAKHNTVESYTQAPGMAFPAVAGVYGKVVRSGRLHVGFELVRESLHEGLELR